MSKFIIIFLAICMGGCTLLREYVPPTLEVSPETTSQSPAETITVSAPTATETTLPTIMTTPTNMPTVFPGDEVSILSRFVQENGGCFLPCVMGLSPGTSNQMAIEAFYRFFTEHSRFSDDRYDNVNIVSSRRGSYGGVSLSFWRNLVGVNAFIDYYGHDDIFIDYIILEATSEGYSNEGLLRTTYGDDYFTELMQPFTLPIVLKDYGMPDYVLILPIPEHGSVQPPRRDPIFNTVLVYESKGFVIQYVSLLGERENNYIGCPSQAHIFVTAWIPGDTIASTEAAQYYTNVFNRAELNFEHYRFLEDVTELSMADFYLTFTQSSDACIGTSVELWP